MFSALFRKQKKKTPHPPMSLTLQGQDIPILMRKNPRARRLILRRDKKKHGFVVTLPPGCSRQQGIDFALQHQDWMVGQLKKSSPKMTIGNGMVLPLRGQKHEIFHDHERRGVVWLDETTEHPKICVSGDEAHIERRLKDWLKKQARADLNVSVEKYAQRLGVQYERVSLRDQTSRWGSCSSKGNLSFSWRLILAPNPVLDYVAAHEVAHLIEMNHSQDFWDIVERLMPEYKTHTKWLKQNGAKLHQYF